MIVPMKYLTLLCMVSDKAETLEQLRKLGCVHLVMQDSESGSFRDAQARQSLVEKALAILAGVEAGKPVVPTQGKGSEREGITLDRLTAPLPGGLKGPVAEEIGAVLNLAEERQFAVSVLYALEAEQTLYAPFGNFDPALAGRLGSEGLQVKLFRQALDAPLPKPEKGLVQVIERTARDLFGVLIGTDDLPEGAVPIPLPTRSAEDRERLMAAASERITKITDLLTGALPLQESFRKELARCNDQLTFVQAADTMGSRGEIAWITGWLPAPAEEQLRTTAREACWGLLLRDPAEGETPPTLLEPPKLFKPVLTLFQALGIAPAYNEADVSVPFFAFFSIFFAMLVGDGGYGAIILGLTLWMRHKMPKAPKSPFVLMTVFSIATIIWGFLSDTWFGLSPVALQNPVSQWLGDPTYKNIMLLCFTLGVIHLSVARIWNAIVLFPDTKFLAEIGWAGVVVFMYCMTCNVVGIFTPPSFIYWILGVSLVLIFGFTLKKSELKEHGIELGMMPLTIVGTLGDIISYVRLFAVGLASVKVAQNFNDMAVGLNLPIWAKIIPMLLILLIGHGLNFAMAGLSILVHAVRLNTLEFSNHKGISWSGYAYKPFKRKTEETVNA